MRKKFDEQLAQLNDSLVFMGSQCEECISVVTAALLNNDAALAKRAKELEKEIDESEKNIQSLCLKLLLQQQPVASDLRRISAALKMITDMERIGDHGSDIAEMIRYVDIKSFSEKHARHISDMASATIQMLKESVNAFVLKDKTKAQSISKMDDTVDEIFIKVKQDILALITDGKPHDKSYGEQLLDIFMIAKYFERIGDHAVNISEWVLFEIE